MKALIVAAIVFASGRAEARTDWMRIGREVQGGAWLHYEATILQQITDDTAPVPDQLILAGVRLHGFLSTSASVAYHIGMDLAAGGTLHGGGFAYDVALFPIGVGVRFGRTSIATVGLGVGAIGATGTLDDAVTLPLEVNLEMGSGRLRLLARGRAAYVAGAASRHDGAPSAPFADELDATIGLRVGHHYEEYDFPTGNGYFVGASYRELAGAKFVGLTIGYSIDLAQPRRFRQPEPEVIDNRGERRCDARGRNCVRLL